MALHPYRDEQLNYFKFVSLVCDEFPAALRHAFRTTWDNTIAHHSGFQRWDDSSAVRNLFVFTEGGTTSVPTQQSYMEWDCTALFQATIFANSFAIRNRTLSDLYVKRRAVPNGSFHASVSSPGGNDAETFALAIDQLRRLRNVLFHTTSSEIHKPTFDLYIQRTKDAFRALGVSTATIDAIGSLNESDFPTSRVHELEQRIRQENQSYIKWLEGVSVDIGDIKEILGILFLCLVLLGFLFFLSLESQTASKEGVGVLKAKIVEDVIPALKKLNTKLEGHIANKDGIATPRRKNEEQPKIVQEDPDSKLKTSGDHSYLKSHKHALDSTRKLFGEEHASTADSYHEVGSSQYQLGDYSAALQSHKRALDIRRKLFGEVHASTADSYHNVAFSQYQLGDYSSALQSHKRVLDIRRKLFGEEHASTAESYYNVGCSHYQIGNYPSALRSYKSALDINRKLFGEEHASTADSYHNIGCSHYRIGNYSAALRSHKRALDINRKLFGEEHAGTADSYHELGNTQHELGDYSSASQSRKRASDIRRKLFGEEHASTADSYEVGYSHYQLGDYSNRTHMA